MTITKEAVDLTMLAKRNEAKALATGLIPGGIQLPNFGEQDTTKISAPLSNGQTKSENKSTQQ